MYNLKLFIISIFSLVCLTAFALDPKTGGGGPKISYEIGDKLDYGIKGDKLIIDLKQIQDFDLHLKNGKRFLLEDLKDIKVDPSKKLNYVNPALIIKLQEMAKKNNK
jgi:hypothetical protein